MVSASGRRLRLILCFTELLQRERVADGVEGWAVGRGHAGDQNLLDAEAMNSETASSSRALIWYIGAVTVRRVAATRRNPLKRTVLLPSRRV